MQSQAGLNREFRRDFKKTPVKDVELGDALGREFFKGEWPLVTYFISPRQRLYCFWYYMKCLKEPHKHSGKKAYAMAISVQFLKAYAPDWFELNYEESTLIEACSEWKEIKKGLEKNSFLKDIEIIFGVFMIWPRLLDDLTVNWANINVDQRKVVSNAIFALTSISYTQWFIEQALKLCPDLDSELGHLLKIGIRATSNPTSKDEIIDSEFESMADAVDESKEINSMWNSITQRLIQIAKDWPSDPSKECLQSLIELGKDSQKIVDQLPEKIDLTHLFHEALNLIKNCLNEEGSKELITN